MQMTTQLVKTSHKVTSNKPSQGFKDSSKTKADNKGRPDRRQRRTLRDTKRNWEV